jgi:hypothetical protein
MTFGTGMTRGRNDKAPAKTAITESTVKNPKTLTQALRRQEQVSRELFTVISQNTQSLALSTAQAVVNASRVSLDSAWYLARVKNVADDFDVFYANFKNDNAGVNAIAIFEAKLARDRTFTLEAVPGSHIYGTGLKTYEWARPVHMRRAGAYFVGVCPDGTSNWDGADVYGINNVMKLAGTPQVAPRVLRGTLLSDIELAGVAPLVVLFSARPSELVTRPLDLGFFF